MNCLEKTWCKESCSLNPKELWPAKEPSKGQCFVSAVAGYERFGGAVMKLQLDHGALHFYNRIDGVIVDFTSDRFPFELSVDFYSLGSKTDLEKKPGDPVKRVMYLALKEMLYG